MDLRQDEQNKIKSMGHWWDDRILVLLFRNPLTEVFRTGNVVFVSNCGETTELIWSFIQFYFCDLQWFWPSLVLMFW